MPGNPPKMVTMAEARYMVAGTEARSGRRQLTRLGRRLLGLDDRP